ncbi:MAG: hypothetical protein V3U54_09665, partial [Thermodesulfobacteriota bacterium]
GMALGYAAEDPLTGGQRKRKAYETIYSSGTYGTPFSSNPETVKMREQLNMLQNETQLDSTRLEDINNASKTAGLPERS